MGAIAFPQLAQQRCDFPHPLSGIPSVQPRHEALVFIGISATSDSEFQPAACHQIGRGSLAGQLDRMPERRDDRASAQPYIPGAMRQIHDRKEGVGRNGELHSVMFTSPDRPHPALVSQLAQRNEIRVELGM